MATRKQTNQRLREDVDLSRAAYEASTARFMEILSSTPSGLPHPDGVKRIELVARERKLAMEQLADAVRNLSDFLIDDGAYEPEDASG